MQTVTEVEMDLLIEQFQKYLGWELQQYRFDEKALQLMFYSGGEKSWFTFAMKPGNPYFFFDDASLSLVKSLKKPLGLFIKTHFIGRRLTALTRDRERGRILKLLLDGDGECSIECHLVPGRVNTVTQVNGKSVFAFKPQVLQEKPKGDNSPLVSRVPRPLPFFIDLWQTRQGQESKTQAKGRDKDLKKKKVGLEKIQQKITDLWEDRWRQLGEWLREHQSFDELPMDFQSMVQMDKSLSWNIDNCFSQSKKSQSKIPGALQRLVELEKEIADLELGKVEKTKSKTPPSLLALADIKGKTHQLQEGRLFVGKSGTENLKILRKAKPWYYWLHIKDFPGAYGIIERNKGQKLSEASLQEAALAVARQSLPSGVTGRFEVIYAECRYVRPIKGAKSGQVTYSHERVLAVKVEK